MLQSRDADCSADQVVGQERRPQFLANHRRRLATHVIEVQRLLDAVDVQLGIPAKAVEFGDRFGL